MNIPFSDAIQIESIQPRQIDSTSSRMIRRQYFYFTGDINARFRASRHRAPHQSGKSCAPVQAARHPSRHRKTFHPAGG
ncbi:hypothetical protein BCEN4_830016 [Burkholderia cenocepacia]|nr:hypothetical protein BCEN4_830016 [Burkholderia cenocepacia]